MASPYFRRTTIIRWLAVQKEADTAHAIARIAGTQGEDELALA